MNFQKKIGINITYIQIKITFEKSFPPKTANSLHMLAKIIAQIILTINDANSIKNQSQ